MLDCHAHDRRVLRLQALPDASMTGGGAATSPADIQAVQAADEEAAALPSNAAASVLGESLSAGPKAPDTNLASSSSGNAPADGGVHQPPRCQSF